MELKIKFTERERETGQWALSVFFFCFKETCMKYRLERYGIWRAAWSGLDYGKTRLKHKEKSEWRFFLAEETAIGIDESQR